MSLVENLRRTVILGSGFDKLTTTPESNLDKDSGLHFVKTLWGKQARMTNSWFVLVVFFNYREANRFSTDSGPII